MMNVSDLKTSDIMIISAAQPYTRKEERRVRLQHFAYPEFIFASGRHLQTMAQTGLKRRERDKRIPWTTRRKKNRRTFWTSEEHS